MFLMWIVPLLLIGLLIYAIPGGNNITNAFKPAASRVCPHCNQPAQNDWKTCAYCGSPLGEAQKT